MCKGVHNYRMKSTVPEMLAFLSGAYTDSMDKDDTSLVYNNDIFGFRCLKAEASQFQFHQLANVIGAPIMSIYPIMEAH